MVNLAVAQCISGWNDWPMPNDVEAGGDQTNAIQPGFPGSSMKSEWRAYECGRSFREPGTFIAHFGTA